jgi:hypothetical protein
MSWHELLAARGALSLSFSSNHVNTAYRLSDFYYDFDFFPRNLHPVSRTLAYIHTHKYRQHGMHSLCPAEALLLTIAVHSTQRIW